MRPLPELFPFREHSPRSASRFSWRLLPFLELIAFSKTGRSSKFRKTFHSIILSAVQTLKRHNIACQTTCTGDQETTEDKELCPHTHSGGGRRRGWAGKFVSSYSSGSWRQTEESTRKVCQICHPLSWFCKIPPLSKVDIIQTGKHGVIVMWLHSMGACIHICLLYIPPLTTNKGHVIQTSACCLEQAIITPKLKTRVNCLSIYKVTPPGGAAN